jgi:membrane protein implicated in regulation of membrane protease activity
MIYVFIGLVFLGLVAGVRIMLYGVERKRPEGDETPRSFSLTPAVIASFSFAAGIVGYIGLRKGASNTGSLLAALAAGAIAAFGAGRVVAAWWKVVPEHDVDDERYVLQGSLGKVIRAVSAQVAGEISLESSGHATTIPARSVDDCVLAAGTEVVIERIEDGVAYVEDWATVEKRL